MKITWIILMALATRLAGNSQTAPSITPPDWQKMSDWKIYAENKFPVVFRIPTDSLIWMPSGPLSSDTMKMFLTGVEKIEGVNPQWMGCYLASCKDQQGHIYKLVISHYGGFFYNPQDKIYYQVPAAVSREWLTFFSDSYMRLFVNTNRTS